MNLNDHIKKINEEDPSCIPRTLFVIVSFTLISLTPFIVTERSPFFNYGAAVDQSRSLILKHSDREWNRYQFSERMHLIASAMEREWTEDQLVKVAKEKDSQKLSMYEQAISHNWPQEDVIALFVKRDIFE
jgi:hypothetical protein